MIYNFDVDTVKNSAVRVKYFWINNMKSPKTWKKKFLVFDNWSISWQEKLQTLLQCNKVWSFTLLWLNKDLAYTDVHLKDVSQELTTE